jgi:2-oxoglutarate dehydrogenase E2 component (dihydrolipoamide succinyltransferase)
MPTKIVVPELGESIVGATVVGWLKHEGERVTVGETVLELETEKVNLEVGATQTGVLAHIARQAGDDVHVGDVLGVIEEAPDATATAAAPPTDAAQNGRAAPEGAPATPAPPPLPPASPAPQSRTGSAEKVTPVAKRLAQQHNIDVQQVASRSPSGRITRDDVQAYLQQHTPAEQPTAPQATPPTTLPSSTAPPREERQRMSRRRRTIARRLVEALRTAAMLTTYNEVDMSAVMALRARRKAAFIERHGVSLGIVSFFVKAAIGALRDFPQLNAEIADDEVVLKHYYDIGIAIGATAGLVVPVLRDADRLSLAAIERAIKTYAQKAEDGTLALADLRGGTFTITNGGVFGSLLSTPILNPPQVGILGLHKITERPVVSDGAVVIRPMMYVALSYDHRLVDGRESVQFLARIKDLIEDPEGLLLKG